MFMKKIVIIVISAVLSLASVSGRTLSGFIHDKSNKGIEFASIAFFLPDSTFLTGIAADEYGNFSIDTLPDSIIAKITSAGYQPLMRSVSALEFHIDIAMDSVVTNLHDIVVTAKTLAIKDGTTTLYPTKQQKQFADGGIDVLKNIGFSNLIVNPTNDEIKTLSGEKVAVYINSLAANSTEVKNIRPQDIKKIEIIHSPSDPRYNGNSVVLNFVLVSYEYGGYTKFNALQKFIDNRGNYSIYSKMAFKSVILDLIAGTSYIRDSHIGSFVTSQYKFPDLDVKREEDARGGIKKTNATNVSLRAIYSKNDISVANTIGFNLSGTPQSNKNGGVDFSSELYDSSNFYSNLSSKRKGVEWNGSYYFSLSKTTDLSILPYASYNHLTENSLYLNPPQYSVFNNITENIFRSRININLTRGIKSNAVGLLVTAGYNDNHVKYASQEDSKVTQRETFVSVGINSRMKFWDSLIWSIKGWVSYQHQSINTKSYDYWIPHLFTSINLSLKDTHAFRLSAEYSAFSNGAAYESPVMIIENEIDAVKGNPYLRNYHYIGSSLSYGFYPSNTFGISASVGLEHYIKPTISIWNPDISSFDHPLMVKTYTNNGNFSEISVGLSPSLNLFNGKLNVQVSPMYYFYKQTGIYDKNSSHFRLNSSLRFYIKNVQLSVSYQTKSTNVNENYSYSYPQFYSVTAAWAFKGLLVKLSANNIFNSDYFSSKKIFNSPLFNSTGISYSSSYHRSVSLSLSYSFNYGKKIKTTSDLNYIGGASSAILR